MAQQKVEKCICHDRSFEEVKAYAQKQDIHTIDELREQDFCSNGCGLCSAYVEMLLETGQTEFSPGEPFGR